MVLVILGYGLKHAIEDLPHDQPSFINLPPLWMTHFQIILEFDHELKKMYCLDAA